MLKLFLFLLFLPLTFFILLGTMEILMKMGEFGRKLARNIIHPLVNMLEGIIGFILLIITLLVVVSQILINKLKDIIIFYYKN